MGIITVGLRIVFNLVAKFTEVSEHRHRNEVNVNSNLILGNFLDNFISLLFAYTTNAKGIDMIGSFALSIKLWRSYCPIEL